MAYVIPRASGSWELRESHVTPAGPRSRTLATFKELTPEVIERARARASEPLDPAGVRRVAARAGAPVAAPAADRASAELLTELEAGRSLRPVLRRLLADALGETPDAGTSHTRAAAAWIGTSPRLRGDALVDLLLLADRFPARRRARTVRYPRLDSSGQ